ncbi:MAG TPA: GNAT family N-acetyltransferase [Rubrivivax sp.]|nr:GNAT family N-acetyltransferase [Pseudomonadota bacterium]HPP82841.1 GNAT family N-acetyltransferase [Rubrivivax sp.]
MSTPVVASAVTIRKLTPADFDAVVAIDAATEGRTRREYVERRLDAARREPTLHAQFGAEDGSGLIGCMLGRVLAGEFGRDRPALRLEMMGVRADRRGTGVGRALFDAMQAWARRHDIAEVRTSARWRQTPILAWFDALDFELAHDLIVDCAVAGHAEEPVSERDVASPDNAMREISYGGTEANDHERLARDLGNVRSMTAADLDAVVRIDRTVSGRDRRGYISARFGEAMDNASVRVSLVACSDGIPAGYLMARADLGDFGRTAPVAVIDTLGVSPDYARRGYGRALLSQLFANLDALRVERVETIVPQMDLELLGFLYAAGFAPAERLSFVRPIAKAA